MRLQVETEAKIEIGDFSDLEFDMNIKMETYEIGKNILPSFIIFDNLAK